MSAESLPWFRRPDDPLPFRPSRRVLSVAADAPDYRTVACFPWSRASLDTLWDGRLRALEPEKLQACNEMISQYAHAIAVGADHRAYIVFMDKRRPPIRINLPEVPPEKLIAEDKIHVAWALSENRPDQPVLIITRGSLVYIYNSHLANQGMAGYLRGHGSPITSVAVHPTQPNLFCTTSRDTTTRIYSLEHQPMRHPNNDAWPPSDKPSLAGAAHGLHANESEGGGIGRCIIVLMGGRSGGHVAAVLGAAFHQDQPLIATCGMDRCVKIWAFRPPSDPSKLIREDKPLFSSSRIHRASVLSVSWLQSDLLLTHSAPAEMRVNPIDTSNKETYLEAGQVIVWRWLGLNRFFPPEKQDVQQAILRGCASDYQESSSFSVTAAYALDDVQRKYHTHNLHFFQNRNHDPVIFTNRPGSDRLLITNIASLKPRNMPTFSEALPELMVKDMIMRYNPEALVQATNQMRISSTSTSDGDGEDEGDNDNAPPIRPSSRTQTSSSTNGGGPETRRAARLRNQQPFRPAFQPLPLPGWDLPLPDDALDSGGRVNSVAMSASGRTVVGIGTKSTIWVWRLAPSSAASSVPSSRSGSGSSTISTPD